MRQMVGLIQRQGIFYFRRTVPEPLRAIMPSVIQAAKFGIFENDAPVTLRGSRAGREFWVSLKTRDPDQARDRARKLDGEADRLFALAERRMTLASRPKITDLPDADVENLVATFRHRKLTEDEQRRRGSQPLSQEQFEVLGAELTAREGVLRDANARGDCAPTHWDHTAIMTVLDAGLNIELDSPADRSVYLSFVEAELDVVAVIKERHSGFTRPTPQASFETFRSLSYKKPANRSRRQQVVALPSLDTIIDGWATEKKPQPKTIDTFRRKLHWWESFLTARDVTIHSAARADASDWKLHLLSTRSPGTVIADLNAVKAIYSWGFDNAKLSNNPFAGLKPPRKAKNGAAATKRGYTDQEAFQILTAARARKGYRRWAPWIAYYTGARISEVCQLEVADIAQIDGIHFFRMQTESEEVGALVGRDGVDEASDGRPQSLDGAFGGLAQQRLELRERHLDRVEVGAVGRQEQQPRACRLDRRPHGRTLVAAEVVHDDDVAGGEFGYQDLINVDLECVAVDRPVEHERRRDPGQAQARHQGRGLPMTVRDGGAQPLAAQRASAQAGWHTTKKLPVPDTITLLPFPARSPKLNPVENVWQFMRDNWLGNRIFQS